jgi:hypothetical protein
MHDANETSATILLFLQGAIYVPILLRHSGDSTGWLKVSVHLMITEQKKRKNILNSFDHHDIVVRIRNNRWH